MNILVLEPFSIPFMYRCGSAASFAECLRLSVEVPQECRGYASEAQPQIIGRLRKGKAFPQGCGEAENTFRKNVAATRARNLTNQ
jgi:hypothetical protein